MPSEGWAAPTTTKGVRDKLSGSNDSLYQTRGSSTETASGAHSSPRAARAAMSKQALHPRQSWGGRARLGPGSQPTGVSPLRRLQVQGAGSCSVLVPAASAGQGEEEVPRAPPRERDPATGVRQAHRREGEEASPALSAPRGSHRACAGDSNVGAQQTAELADLRQ